MRPDTYEMTFTGRADKTLCAQFDDRNVTTGLDTTTLRAGLPDPAALSGLVQRIAGYAEQMGCTFRLASPSLSLVKIMRITGLDRTFLAFQVPEQAAGLRLP